MIKEKIIQKAHEIGIDKIGFADAAPFDHLKDSLQEQIAAGHQSGFEHPVLEERLDPSRTFEDAQTLIAIALAYPTKMKEKVPRVRGERRGQFARASWGEDYHYVLREKMTELISYLETITDETIRFKSMVDTGELIDVAVAHRAGLGFIGKNGLLITPEFGSFVYLGEIVTNLKIEPDEMIPNGCGDCERCLVGCPTGALLGDGRMNAQRCLSYQTQVKNYIPEKYRKKMGSVIYGCDICQLVCPYNRGMDFHLHDEMEPNPDEVTPLLQPMLTVSNREFKEQFGHLAGSWRGKKPLQRNAIIALANTRDRSAIPLLLELIEQDPRPMIRGISAWAVARLAERSNAVDLSSFLKEALAREEDQTTIEEFEEAIKKLERREK